MMGIIKFIFKIVIVLIVALAAVIYHNTDSGRNFEKRVGEEVRYENLKKRAKNLYDKTVSFLSLKGIDNNKNKTVKEEKVEKNKLVTPSAPETPAVDKGISEKMESIKEEDRKKLEEIIQNEG